MDKMGYADQPFIVYKHEDIERKHIHIVSLRVDENGKKINDKFEHRRSMDTCREIEHKYNLIPANQKQKKQNLPIKPVIYEDGDIKHQIANIIRTIPQEYYFSSLKEYNTLLSLYQIGIEEVKGEKKGNMYHGLTYSALNNNGDKIGHPIKSSSIGKNVGIEALEQYIQRSKQVIQERNLKERSKKVITSAMKSHSNRSAFEKELEKQNISAVFRTNDQGRIYGVTFIDHEQKAVLNGSRLGKELSANVFNEHFNNKNEQATDEIQQKITHAEGASYTEKITANDIGDTIGGLFSFSSHDFSEDPDEQIPIQKKAKKKRKYGRQM